MITVQSLRQIIIWIYELRLEPVISDYLCVFCQQTGIVYILLKMNNLFNLSISKLSFPLSPKLYDFTWQFPIAKYYLYLSILRKHTIGSFRLCYTNTNSDFAQRKLEVINHRNVSVLCDILLLLILHLYISSQIWYFPSFLLKLWAESMMDKEHNLLNFTSLITLQITAET